jgi:hypothetical protein
LEFNLQVDRSITEADPLKKFTRQASNHAATKLSRKNGTCG